MKRHDMELWRGKHQMLEAPDGAWVMADDVQAAIDAAVSAAVKTELERCVSILSRLEIEARAQGEHEAGGWLFAAARELMGRPEL